MFSEHTRLRTLAYIFAPAHPFLESLELKSGFRQNTQQIAFRISELVSVRMRVSRRICTTKRNLCMETLYRTLLETVKAIIFDMRSFEQEAFLNFIVYCFSPLAVFMKVYKKNSYWKTGKTFISTSEFEGLPQFRVDLEQLKHSN